MIDAAAALEHANGKTFQHYLSMHSPYSDPVFFAPPWPELYARDAERQQSFSDACAEVRRLRKALAQLNHSVIDLPKTSVPQRVEFVLNHLM